MQSKDPVKSDQSQHLGFVIWVLVASTLWVASATLALGSYLATLKRGASYWCLNKPDAVPFDDVIPESVEATGRWSFFPIGVECTYTSPMGASVVHGPDPTTTILAGIALLLTLLLVLTPLHLRTSAMSRRG